MWYNIDNNDNDIVISSRIRLARNFKKYPFSIKLNDEQALEMLKDVEEIVTDSDFKYIDFKNLSQIEKAYMVENHTISVDFFKKQQPTALLLNKDETISIMINEEDHIRIQTILPGDNIDEVWKIENKSDNFLEEKIEYAYDNKYGYLTSCPTNVGTGMRVSYMLHIPLIELTGQIRHITQFISKFGMTVRGMYGEGSEPQGGIYQISNQITLGQSEEYIISNMKVVVSQVIEQEQKLREKLMFENYNTLADQVYRAYGIITNARIITLSESMRNLSYVRLGYATNIIKESKPFINIHRMMMGVQPANLIKYAGKDLKASETDIIRAEFIRKQFFK